MAAGSYRPHPMRKPSFVASFSRGLVLGALALTTSCHSTRTASQPQSQPPSRGPDADDVRSPAPPAVDAATQRAIGTASARFGLEILARLPTRENALISPLDLHRGLSMLEEGADETTAAQLRAVLHTDAIDTRGEALAALVATLAATSSHPGNVFTSGARVWAARDVIFERRFLDRMRDIFGAPATPLDFAHDTDGARATINTWVADRTQGHIPELLRELLPSTRIVLTTAAYFLGRWRTPFDPASTQPGRFYLTPTTSKSVAMMHGDLRLPLFDSEGVQLLELPYEGGGLVLDVVLPRPGTTLETLAPRLTEENVNAWSERANENVTRVVVTLPRIAVRGRPALREPLTDAGLRDVFDHPNLANLSRSEALRLDQVVHEATVEFSEVGTEASAATAIVGGYAGVNVPPAYMVNRPFFFAIRHRPTHAVLFAGRVMDVDPGTTAVPGDAAHDPDVPPGDPLHPAPSRGLRGRRRNGPSVMALPPTVVGALSPEEIRRVVLRHLNDVTRCYDGALAHDPTANGSATIRFTIDAIGHVVHPYSEPAGDDVVVVAACTINAIHRWVFPPPPSGTVDVRYQFRLRAPE